MLAELTHVEDGGFYFLVDGFDGTALNARWTTASWLSDAPSVVADLSVASAGDEETGVVLDAQSIDTAQAYQIDLFVAPRSGTHNGEYRIYARMDDSTPDATADGIEANLILSGATGAYSGTLKSYVSGTPTTTNFSTGNSTSAQAGIFRVHISSTTVTCSWLGTQVASATVGAHSGKRIGFGIKSTVAGELAAADYFQLQYKKASDTRKARRKMLMAAANGSLYKEGFYGVLSAVSSSLTLVSDRRIRGIDRGQKLYIADHGDPRVEGTAGVIAGAGNDELDDAAVSDWTTLGIDTDDDVAVLSGFSAGTAGTYQISSVATGEVTLASAPGAGTGGTYSIQRGPKIYDPSTDTISLWTATASKGQVPSGCKLITRYRDRLVLAGDQATPHAWYMSRQADPLDWDYSQDFDDAQRAVAGSTSEAGLVGEPINAMVAHSDDYLLFGCDSSLWVLRGDPAFNGQIDNLSHSVGIVGGDAYCQGPNGEVVFLSRDGIYALAPGASTAPVSLSREALPRELIDIDATSFDVSLAYDIRDRGIHVYVTPIDSGGVGLHFWFDWEVKSWWPYTLPSDYEPTALLRYQSDVPSHAHVLLGGRDGFVRRYMDGNDSDESTAISSFVQLGPFALSPNDYAEGMANEITGRLAKGSGDVTWSLQVGDDQEAAQGASSFASATWSEGTNYVERPRARGLAAVLKLTGDGQRWAVEGATLVVHQLGRQRVL
tara:strand:- start:4244 stop:6400 length:2157 start_codon:yes stop_codon:yes gene_type:complete